MTLAPMALLLKNLLFTVIVPGTVAVYLPWWLGSRSTTAVLWQWHHGLALPLWLVGVVVYGWCLWDFMTFGRGTPALIDPPRRLVVRGLYRWVRNPMYYGILHLIAGWIVFFGSPHVLIYGAIIAAGFHGYVCFVEEPALRRRFGEDYVRYCRAVHRWIPARRYAEDLPG